MDNDEKDYLWSYFAFNAEQRIKVFEFFIVLSSLTDGAVIAAYEKSLSYSAFIGLGIYILVIVGVFWTIDHRSKLLFKAAIPGLMRYEKGLHEESRLFTKSEHRDHRHLGYSTAFRILYITQIGIGVITLVYGMLMEWMLLM